MANIAIFVPANIATSICDHLVNRLQCFDPPLDTIPAIIRVLVAFCVAKVSLTPKKKKLEFIIQRF